MAASTAADLQAIDDLGSSRRSLGSSARRSSLQLSVGGSARFGSARHWGGIQPDNAFPRGNEHAEEDEMNLRWAALEKLPTYDRLRTSILEQMKGSKVHPNQVDLRSIGIEENQLLLNNVFATNNTEDDNEEFVKRLAARIARVDIKQPTVEVRYRDISIQATAFVGSRALPTLLNVARNFVEGLFETVGISLTKKIKLQILQNVSGIIKPGRMTLLLGPPGSGKTSLLLALAGRLDPDLKKEGEITFNGYKMNEFVPQKTAAYISQHDLHIGEMTVRETLDFSAQCQGIGQRYDLLAELDKREKERGIYPDPDVDFFMKAIATQSRPGSLITEYYMKILGLDVCADTLLGDEMRRGVSGGQRKRVTTGEMMVGPLRTLLMDEISTGLDTSTTFQIIKCLRDICHVLEHTIVISLLQPAPETFNLFDDVMLLSEGQVVYHGPRENILEFFESCGFKCPERKGIADFLQEVTSRKDQEQYWAEKTRPYVGVPVSQFAEAFKSFHIGVKMGQELAKPFPKETSHKAALSFKRYSVSYMELLKATYAKEKLLVKRNSFIVIFKATQISIMAVIGATVYLRTQMHHRNMTDAQTYAGALFFGVLNIMFNGFAELSLTIARLPVFYKQRDLMFHPPWTFAFSKFILNIPISILESVVWILITYYTIGFDPSAGRFFRQLVLYISVHQMSSGMFRLIAGVCRTMVIANTGGSLTLMLVFTLGGFLLPRQSIKPWWIWAYWVSPLAYSQGAVDVNEYLSPSWDHIVGNDTKSLGVTFLEASGIYPRGRWFWIGVGVNVGYTILFNVLFAVVITYLNPLGKAQAVISEETLAEKHAALTGEMLPSLSKSVRVQGEQGSSLSRSQPGSLSRGGDGQDGVQMSRMSSSGGTKRNSNISIARSSLDSVAATVASNLRRGMILPFEPLSISFDDVSYFVNMPEEMKAQGAIEDRLQLLRKVTGAFRPGVLTALVGVSGAGKSTLMDVLAGRKTGGYIEGDIRISGYPKVQETFARIAGYCEQTDVHSPQVTIEESLIYSAWLRLSNDIDKETRELFVTQVMELVELTPVKDALVGLPGVTGLSTEQRKRLTIAVELVANPSIIFMDEPTSGLDARAAAIVMRTVRNTVDTGRTVVCTIHQPSIDIFESFDELLLMKRGGQVIYAGHLGRHSRKLVEYFESIPGVPKIKEGYNPATWMLDVSSPGVEQRLQMDFAEIYEKSELYQRNKALVQELSKPSPQSKDLWFDTQYSQPFFTQVQACLWKQNITYWRSPQYNNVRFVFTTFAAFLFGTIFWQMGHKRGSQGSIFSIMGAMLGAVLFIGVNNSSTVQPVVATERTVFYRERAAGMYSAVPYAIAQVLIEFPYCFLQTMIYSSLTYAMIGLEWTAAKFLWYAYVMLTTFLYFTFYGMMAVGLTPNHHLAAVMSAFFYMIWNLFSGFMIFKPRIPGWWIWYYWLSPVAWTIYGLITSQFGDVHSNVKLSDGTFQTVEEFLRDNFGFNHSFLPVVGVMLAIFPVLFAIVFMLAIKYINFQNR